MLPEVDVARGGLSTAARVVSIVLVVELVLLATTGTALFFAYRPSAAQAWDDLGPSLHESITMASALRIIHRDTARLVLGTSLVAAVLLTIDLSRRARVARAVVIGSCLVPLALVSSFTGYLLPWDQLALWAVTIGTDMHGYTMLRDDRVRFVLLGGKEIGKGTLLRWVVIHMALGVALLVVVLPAVGVRWRRRRSGRARR